MVDTLKCDFSTESYLKKILSWQYIFYWVFSHWKTGTKPNKQFIGFCPTSCCPSLQGSAMSFMYYDIPMFALNNEQEINDLLEVQIPDNCVHSCIIIKKYI